MGLSLIGNHAEWFSKFYRIGGDCASPQANRLGKSLLSSFWEKVTPSRIENIEAALGHIAHSIAKLFRRSGLIQSKEGTQ